jgi:predicted deacylase
METKQERKRNFQEITRRLKTAVNSSESLTSLGTIETSNGSYPFHQITLGKGKPRRVVISAGIHGDEPAGVETICTLLEDPHGLRSMEEWEFTLLPCLNPYGYECDTRTNHQNQDLNRLFKVESPPPQITLIRSVFGKPFDLALELHEDVDSLGYYLYQSIRDGNSNDMGQRVIQSVKNIMPVNTDQSIEGMPANQGVIERLSIEAGTMDWWPLALFTLSKGVPQCLTLETSIQFPMETRVQAHLAAIDSALNYQS